MRTIGQLWDAVDSHTQSVSEQSRKLAFAGAGICWFFRVGEATAVRFPELIIAALLSIVFFFVCDISQYLSNAVKLERWTFRQEVRIREEMGRDATTEDTVPNPPKLYKPGDFFYYTKLVGLILAFLLLIGEFTGRLL